MERYLMASMVGQKLGKYELIERLGRGGMAEVYKAYQPGLERFVAIKIISGPYADIPQFVSRFQREARSIAQLRHAHIVQVFDFDVDGDEYYMVMEHIQGGTLHERIQGRGALPVQDMLRIGASLSDALSYAHHRGMIHRDIKPSNVMFADDGNAHPVLTDFGIARILGETSLTTSGFIGTPGYVSPEVGRGEPVDERTDIYSLGVMLYEMATGRLPFYGDTPYAVIMKHIHDPLPSLRQFNADLPESAEEVIYKALAKRTDLRYQTASDLRDALQAALLTAAQPLSPRAAAIKRGAAAMFAASNLTPVLEVETRVLPPETAEPIEPVITEEAVEASAEPERRRRRKPMLLALGLLSILLAAGFLVLRSDGTPGVLAASETSTLPALVVTEESPTPTSTASPTDEPTATASPTDEPTRTATRRVTRAPLTIPTEATDILPTRTPSQTPLPPTATNTPVPPPPAPPPTSTPPEGGGGEQPQQPPPDNGQANPVQDTVDTVGDTVNEVVDGVGDTVGGVTDGLGLP
jgi:serine/threonine-protein kinase